MSNKNYNKEEVVKFLKDLKNMCRGDDDCEHCAFKSEDITDCFYFLVYNSNPDKIVDLMEVWKEENKSKC